MHLCRANCGVPENIHTPHGGQRKLQWEGVVQKEAISEEVWWGWGGGVSYGELFPGAPSKIGELSKLSVI